MHHSLTQSFKEQEKALIELILKIDTVERIYMLGSTLLQSRTETVFMTDAPFCQTAGQYYLLILTNTNTKYGANDLQDRIENTCRSFIAVTVIVLQVEQFITWLLEGHRFAYTIHKSTVLLYSENNIPFPTTTIHDAPANKDNWTPQHNAINEFIAGAELFLLRKQNIMALFMLRQAAEQSLHLLLKKGTGLHFTTHNIDKLIRYCSMVSYKVQEILPRNNEKNERLFSLLQKTYVHKRYKDDFKATGEDIAIIMERVKDMRLYILQKEKI